jgi:lysophospholipase L1-like esterase
MIVVSIVVALVTGETLLRLKNANMKNYDIEMWRYSKDIKRQSENPVLGHEHAPSSSAKLQSVNIRINSDGLRGEDLKPKKTGEKRILFLGSSITLGWGVEEEETLTERLSHMFEMEKNPTKVLNAGIGNYNTVRYVEQFLTQHAHLDPDLIVVQYFVNDAEVLQFTKGSWVLRNSQLGVTLWTAYNRLFTKSGEEALIDHYKSIYNPKNKGFKDMVAALARLSTVAKEKNIPIVLAMTPDIHNLRDYPFDFIHNAIAKISSDLGFNYVDLLPAFAGQDAKEFWSMLGDPHPNATGHKLMADILYPVLKSIELGARDFEAEIIVHSNIRRD